MILPRTRKYSERFLVVCFVVLGIFWIGYLVVHKINKPQSRFEVIQDQVEAYIEQQENRIPLTTKGTARK